jgi:hypothetical protein
MEVEVTKILEFNIDTVSSIPLPASSSFDSPKLHSRPEKTIRDPESPSDFNGTHLKIDVQVTQRTFGDWAVDPQWSVATCAALGDLYSFSMQNAFDALAVNVQILGDTSR